MRLRQEVADNDSVGKYFHSDCANENYCIVLSLGNGKQFKLKCDVGVLKIIYENFAPGNCANAVRADTIIKEYKSLSYESGQIVATVQDNADALDVLLELYAAGWHIEIDGNEGDTYYFKSAYKVMLGKIKSNYPGAEIWCFTLCRPAGDGFSKGLRTYYANANEWVALWGYSYIPCNENPVINFRQVGEALLA